MSLNLRILKFSHFHLHVYRTCWIYKMKWEDFESTKTDMLRFHPHVNKFCMMFVEILLLFSPDEETDVRAGGREGGQAGGRAR